MRRTANPDVGHEALDAVADAEAERVRVDELAGAIPQQVIPLGDHVDLHRRQKVLISHLGRGSARDIIRGEGRRGIGEGSGRPEVPRRAGLRVCMHLALARSGHVLVHHVNLGQSRDDALDRREGDDRGHCDTIGMLLLRASVRCSSQGYW